jgi:hypothetical protein
MAPRKNNNAATASKPRKSPPKKTQNPAPPPKRSRKRKLTPEEEENIPEYDKGVTSKSAREKKRFKLSLSSLLNEEVDEKYITTLSMGLIGESRNSWGTPELRPIAAQKQQKRRNYKNLASGGLEEEWRAMMEAARATKKPPPPIVPNSPGRSALLRLSMEVREQIYGYLLVYNEPILVKHDLITVERNPFQDRSIVLVCRQIAAEASAFIYRTNTVRAIFRRPNFVSRQYEEPSTIETKFHQYFRNVIFDCTSDCWNLGWQEKATRSIERLIEAKSYIATLTLVVVPQRVSMSTTALGVEANPITFADFMWYPGEFMTAIRKLAPQILKIVIKKGPKGHVKRLEFSIDLTHLQASSQENVLMANPETIQLGRMREEAVHAELIGLKERFEEIFEDDEEAINEGKCKIVSDNEKTKSTEKSSEVVDLTAAEKPSEVIDLTAADSSREEVKLETEHDSSIEGLWVVHSFMDDRNLAPM